MNQPQRPTVHGEDRWPLVLEIDAEACEALRSGWLPSPAGQSTASGVGSRLAMLPDPVLRAAVEALRAKRCAALSPRGAGGATWTLVPLEDGRMLVTRLPPGTVGATDAAEAEARVETHRMLREAVFQAFGAPAWILGPDRRVRSANDAARRLARDESPPGTLTLGEALLAAGFEAPSGLPDAVERVYAGHRQRLTVASADGARAGLTLLPVLRDEHTVGVCVTLLAGPEPSSARNASHFNLLMESNGQAMFAWDPQSDEGHWSGAVRSLLGTRAAALTDRFASFLSMLPPEDARGLERDLRWVLKTGRSRAREVRIKREDGTTRVLQCLGARAPSLDAQSAVVGMVSDVTDLVGMRQKSVEAQKHEALGRLAGGVAHDFNNMLTVVQGCVGSLEQVIENGAAGSEDLVDLKQAAARATDLVRQMLSFARKQRVTPSFHEVGELVTSLTPMLRRLLPTWIELKTVIDADTPPLVVDYRQLEQALVNLVINARDAMQRTGVIEVHAHRVLERDEEGNRREWTEITVRDEGDGMPPEVLERIFDPYFTTRPQGRGTGLGLAIVYGIVRAASGEIRVESGETGTTFYMRFPSAAQLHAAAQGLRSLPQATPSILPSPAFPGGPGVSLLLVEDEPSVRRAVTMMLRRAGITAIEAGGLTEALARCPPTLDLLLTDVRMPEAFGQEVARQILARHPRAKVLYMSGYTGSDNDPSSPNPMLRKPFTAAELQQALQDLLGDRLAAAAR